MPRRKTGPLPLKAVQLDAEAQARFDGCVRLAYRIINRYVRRYELDPDDAESAGLQRLCRAAILFDPARGCKFTSYGGKAVENMMVCLVKRQRRQRRQRPRLVTLSAVGRDTKAGDRLPFDPPDTRTPAPCQMAVEREHQASVKATLERAAGYFEPWERHLWETLTAYYLDGKTVREIAEENGIIRETVYLRIKRGIELLRQRLPGLVAGEPITRLFLRRRVAAQAT